MDAKETIKYLYEHGHIPSREHYDTISNELAKHRWIPVSEKLPEKREFIAKFNVKTRWSAFDLWTNTNAEAEGLKMYYTHWMPIIPPEGS